MVRSYAPFSSQISIHALREEGDMVWSGNGVTYTISIHALREEGDEQQLREEDRQCYFYPRPPRGGRR